LTSWEAEREAQRKHFGQEAQKTDDRSGGKRVMDAVTSLLRKVA
jgi:hypothetical protein